MLTSLYYILGFLFIATFVSAFFYIAPMYQQNNSVSMDVKNATQVHEQKRLEAEKLSRLRVGLQSNPSVIERTARERYGYSKEGEYVTNVIED